MYLSKRRSVQFSPLFSFLRHLHRSAFRVIRSHNSYLRFNASPKMETETTLLTPRSIAPSVFLDALLIAWLSCWALSCNRQHKETAAVTINKQPANFARRTFDPANPPADMPALTQEEYAVCDSNFLSNAAVGGETRQTDATHATVTVTHIKVDLQLNITVWVPNEVNQHVAEHEEGHRQISEYYYQTADKLAERIATSYVGKQVDIAGTDLQANPISFFNKPLPLSTLITVGN